MATTSDTVRTSRRWRARLTRCSTRHGRSASGTSTWRGPTGWRSASSARGWRAIPGRRGGLTIGSKWGYTYVADWRVDVEVHEVKDHSLATFERQWPETLDELGTPPDVYLVHSLTADSPALDDAALLARLGELAETGVRVGLSTSGATQADVLRRALALPDGPFSAVQSTWNLLEPSAGDALAEAAARGWHVAVKESVANGRLTDRTSVSPALARVADAHGVGVDAVAVAAACALPVSVVPRRRLDGGPAPQQRRGAGRRPRRCRARGVGRARGGPGVVLVPTFRPAVDVVARAESERGEVVLRPAGRRRRRSSCGSTASS